MKIAVVFGASSGIGRAIAEEIDLLKSDEIWLIARNEEKLRSVASSLLAKSKIIPLDFNDFASFEVLKNLYEKENPDIRFLVCSAGVGYCGSVADIDEKKAASMININCLALTLLTKISLPYMKKGSKIIEIASGAGFLPQPYFSVYAATKSYVISFSRALGTELKKDGISVTAVCPGPVDTDFFSSLENVKEYKKKFLISPKKVAKSAMRCAKRGKAICTPTFSMKIAHLAAKIIPTSLILSFYKK